MTNESQTTTPDRYWTWEPIGSGRFVARVAPKGAEVLRLTGYGFLDWDGLKKTTFCPGMCLTLTGRDRSRLTLECVSGRDAEFAEFRVAPWSEGNHG